jgi:hypothetical protein
MDDEPGSFTRKYKAVAIRIVGPGAAFFSDVRVNVLKDAVVTFYPGWVEYAGHLVYGKEANKETYVSVVPSYYPLTCWTRPRT